MKPYAELSSSKQWSRRRLAKTLGCGVDEVPDGRGKHKKHVKGVRHHRWNNARILRDDGYALIRVGASHPLADSNGYALEHQVVWASAAKPPITQGFVLHHINEDWTDNRIENLELKDNATHSRDHNIK